MFLQQGTGVNEQSCLGSCCWRCGGWINGLEKIGGGRSIRNLLLKDATNSTRERAGEAAVNRDHRDGENCRKTLS